MHAALAYYSQAVVAAPLNSRETALAIGMAPCTFLLENIMKNKKELHNTRYIYIISLLLVSIDLI